MNCHTPFSHRATQAVALMFIIAGFVSGCSESSESLLSDSQSSTTTPGSIASTVELDTEIGNVEVTNTPAVVDPLIQNTVSVSFDITVPEYQSNELRVELVWGDMTINAMWVGDEIWSASGEFPTETEHPLTVTFYDSNGGVELAQYTNAFRTASNVTEAFLISADQFDSDQFDTDIDGVSNLDESIAGTSLIVDEDSLLDIVDTYTLSRSNRMSVWSDLESFVTDSRPLVDTVEIEPPYAGFSGTIFGDVDIDANGNGTLTYGYYVPNEQLRYTGTRTHLGSSISWEGDRAAYDGDYRHSVSFSNTVTVVDETTREIAEDISGNNNGGYLFSWEASTRLTGTRIEGTSLCKPVAGTFSATYRDVPTEVTDISISKEIGDSYWRVEQTRTTNRLVINVEATEYFVRELIMYLPSGSPIETVAPEHKYFTCDFVDI